MLCLAAALLLLPGFDTPALAMLACGLLVIGMVVRAGRRLLKALASIRLLLAALLIVYLALTPGPPLVPALPGLSRDGAALGAHRALLLVDFVLCVALLLHGLTPEALAAALPLRYFGVGGQRAARQLALCLHATADSGRELARLRRDGGLVDGLARWCLRIEQAALQGPVTAVELPRTPALRLQHWAVFGGFLLGFHLLGRWA